MRLSYISYKIHSQTPPAFAAGAGSAAHRRSTRDHHGESSLDKPVVRTNGMCPREEAHPWTARPLADRTFEGGSLASAHALGRSCKHATRSTRQASGCQQAAICYSWSRGGLKIFYSPAKNNGVSCCEQLT